MRSALTVAVALAQIGEFSFLLTEEASRLGLLPAEGHSLLVACAILSIALNPLLFLGIEPLEKRLRSKRNLWRKLSQRAEVGAAELNLITCARLADVDQSVERPMTAVIVGYGPVGQTACRILKEFGIQPVIVDLNLDTVRGLAGFGELAVYGNATQRDILEAAGIKQATYVLVTIPEVLVRSVVIMAAKDLNPALRIFARARYIQERAWLEEVGATGVVTEEAETAVGLAVLLLREVGADEERIQTEIRRINEELSGSSVEEPVEAP